LCQILNKVKRSVNILIQNVAKSTLSFSLYRQESNEATNGSLLDGEDGSREGFLPFVYCCVPSTYHCQHSCELEGNIVQKRGSIIAKRRCREK
jgi:hypothetical protein